MKKLFSTVLSLFTICAFSGFAQEDVSGVQNKSAILIAVNSNDGVGYFTDLNGRKLFGLDFQNVSKFVNGLAAVKKDDKWGCINSRGEFKIPCVYDDLALMPKGIVVMTGEMFGLMDYDGKEIYPCVFDYLPIYGEALTKVMVDGKYGVMNSEFELVIPCVYDACEAAEYNYSEETIEPESNIVVTLGDKCGMLSPEGETLIECLYDDLCLYTNYVVAKKDGLCGCLNLNEEVVVPFIYDDIIICEDGNFVAEKNGKYGYVDSDNNLIVPFEYDDLSWSPYYKLLFSTSNETKGLITKGGELVFSGVYDSIYPVTENLFIVIEDEKYGLADRYGTVVLPCKYEYIDDLSNEDGMSKGYLIVYDGEKYGSVNYLGEQVVPCIYDELVAYVYKFEFDDYFDYDARASEVMRRMLPDGRYEYVNVDGKKLPNDEDFGSFFLGFATAKQNGKYGLMNMDGDILVPCIYDEDFLFLPDALVVRKNGKYGTISYSGEELIPCEYDACEPLRYMLSSLILKQNDGYIIVSADGTMEYPYVFEDVMDCRSSSGCDVVKMAGKWWCLYGQEGAVLIPDGEIVPYVEDAACASRSMSKNEMMLSDIDEYMSDLIFLRCNHKYKLVNKFGKVIVPSCNLDTCASEID